MSREFGINKYLVVKLEGKKTNIYVGGEFFRNCAYILADIPQNLDNIDSIDNLVAIESDIKISPDEEFWGHCSNLQLWYEYNYDTRLLKSNISFPLLKELSKAGDDLAKSRFIEEIKNRLKSGNPNVVTFLLNNNYDEFLDDEEFIKIMLNDQNLKTLRLLNHALKVNFNEKALLLPEEPEIDIPIYDEWAERNPFHFWSEGKRATFACRKGEVVKLYISRFPEFIELPQIISDFSGLEELYLEDNNLKKIPDWITLLRNLKLLYIYDENLEAYEYNRDIKINENTKIIIN